MDVRTAAQRFLFVISFLILNLTVACQTVSEPEPETTFQPTNVALTPVEASTVPPLSIPVAEPDTETPAGVVDAFYSWYLDPQRSGDVEASPYLSRRLIDASTQTMAGKRLGADPFLLAQDVPAAIRVEEVTVGVATAQIVLHQYWNLDLEEGTQVDRTIDLVREDGAWKIDRIQRGSPLTPHGVVELYFNWYFNYGEPDRTLGSVSYALASSGNPLLDRAYRHSPYLAPALIAGVDAIMAQFADPETVAVPFDPFLRARNHPLDFFVMIHETEIDGLEARVPLQLTYGQEQTTVEVIVTREGGRWQISGVQGQVPGEATAAAQVVSMFGDLYYRRWYTYAEEHGLPHTGDVDLGPFLAQVEEIYDRSPFISPAFAAAAAEQIAHGDGAIDPFFQTAAVPATMDVEGAWADGDHAEVRMHQRWLEGHEVRPLTVKLVCDRGRWLIAEILPGAEGPVVVNPEAQMHPADVVRAFFAGYLAQGGFAGGAHRENRYLSPALAGSVESDVTYLRSLGIPVEQVDPILHSATAVLPDDVRVEVDAATVDEAQHRAVVRASRIYDGGASLPLTVFLSREWDNQWTIQDIGAVGLPGTAAESVEVADEMWLGLLVASWYEWALAYGAQPESAIDLPSLLRFDMEAEGGLTFCTTTWPRAFAVESVFLEPGAERGAQRAMIVLRSTEAHALLILELEQRDWLWAIVDQHCGDTPAGRARAFYTAYLGHLGDPFAERAYARGDYLTADLIMALDNSGDALQTDPLTLSQETPRWFEVQPGPASNSAIVTLSFADGTAHSLHLSLVLVDGRWLLSKVARAG